MELAVPLSEFAKTLLPQVTRRNPRTGVPLEATSGEPDQVWLTLLNSRHGMERHTIAEWHALIDGYRNEPAHPACPQYGTDSSESSVSVLLS